MALLNSLVSLKIFQPLLIRQKVEKYKNTSQILGVQKCKKYLHKYAIIEKLIQTIFQS